MPAFHTGVIHGRFQVLHNDHLKYLLAGKARCQHLVIGIANPDPSLTNSDPSDHHRAQPSANPLTYYERYRMLHEVLVEANIPVEEFSIVPFPINYPSLLQYYVPLEAVFFLNIYDDWGERKLALLQELGLRTEVLGRRPLAQKGLTATTIRKNIQTNAPWQQDVPPATARLVKAFNLQQRLVANNSSQSE